MDAATFLGYILGRWLLWACICGGIGYLIGKTKGRPTAGFWWGATLGIIGWVIVLVGPDLRPHCGKCQIALSEKATLCWRCGSTEILNPQN